MTDAESENRVEQPATSEITGYQVLVLVGVYMTLGSVGYAAFELTGEWPQAAIGALGFIVVGLVLFRVAFGGLEMDRSENDPLGGM